VLAGVDLMTDLAMLLQRLAAPRISVVKDLILDCYVWEDGVVHKFISFRCLHGK
jgi:hypothetical protein